MKSQMVALGMTACFTVAYILCNAQSPGYSRPDVPPGLLGTDPHRITIVDMIPRDRSDEDKNDSEPNIAVNARDTSVIAASVFTRTSDTTVCSRIPCVAGSYPSCRAPLYLSTDGGRTWHLEEVLASNNGITHDISVAFGPTGYLYASFLEGCYATDNVYKGFMTMKSVGPITSAIRTGSLGMSIVDSRLWGNTNDTRRYLFDQPWIIVTPRGTSDHVFIGVNRVGEAISNRLGGAPGTGRTARVIVSQNGANNSFTGIEIERVRNFDKNLSAIRVAAHPNGKVYAIFYRWISGGTASGGTELSGLHPYCDVIVERDDRNGTLNFNQLNESSGSSAGKRVGSGLIPLCRASASVLSERLPRGSSVGRVRLVGSNLTIAVDPIHDDHVVVAWCSLDGGVYTLHSRESLDGGITWNNMFTDLTNTLNPALAVASDGRVGLLYQQLTSTTYDGSQVWQTHFTMGFNGASGLTTRDYLLYEFANDSLPVLDEISVGNRPSLGDYVDLEAVDDMFYGVFPAFNIPVPGSVPITTPVYQRGYNERGPSDPSHGGRSIRGSVDPFFFKINPASATTTVGRM